MKPAPFQLHRPESLDEAVRLLAELGDEARPIAGGQSLVPLMNLRMARPEHLVDLNRIEGLSGIRTAGNGIEIGAMTRQCDLIGNDLVADHVPLLDKAMGFVGHVQTRSRGTVGGSLSHADPSAELALVAVTLRATFTVTGPSGNRTLNSESFFADALSTALEPGELLTAVAFPGAAPGTRSAFREVSRRHGDFAMAAAAVQYSSADTVLQAALGGVAPVPFTCASVEQEGMNVPRSHDDWCRLVAADLEDVEILSDTHASADYRRRLSIETMADCLEEVAGQ